MIFKNFKQAHEYNNYPGSHRIGSYGDSKGIIRTYSNGKNGDMIKNNIIYYVLKMKIKILKKKKTNFI